MLVGLVIALSALFFNDVPFFAKYIPPGGSALVAAPANALVNIIVSLMTPPPPKEVQDLLRQVHLSA